VLYIRFASSCLASLGWSLTCLPACLLDKLTIILSIMDVTVLELLSKIVLFFCIRTDPLYRYYFLVPIPIFCISIIFLYSYWSLYLYCFPHRDIYYAYWLTCYYMLLLDTWRLHAINWHLFHITYHLPPDTLLLTLWLSYFGNPIFINYIIDSDMYFLYLYTHVTPKPVLLLLFS